MLDKMNLLNLKCQANLNLLGSQLLIFYFEALVVDRAMNVTYIDDVKSKAYLNNSKQA